MADEPRMSSSSGDGQEATDWEEAFQADDFVLSPTEQAESTLLQQDAASGQGPAPADARPAAGRPGRTGLLARLAAGRRVLLLGVAGLLLAVVAGGGLLLFLRPGPVADPPQPAGQPPSPPATAGGPAPASPPAPAGLPEPPFSPPATASPPATGPDSRPPAARDAERPLDLPPPVAQAQDRERRKIRLAGFMIDVADERGGGPRYVAVDCSLVLRMAPEDEFPLSRRYMLRDAIYLFFANRPYYELRRYALARGELKRKLLAWLRKQWPDGPIEAIVFHKYSLL